jgi:lipoprotein signal peptidase
MIYATALFLFCILLDQASKLLAINNGYVLNHGLALNIGQNMPRCWLLFFIILIVVAVSAINLRHWKKNKNIAELIVIAGGFSNLIDRFRYNGVVDFIIIDFKISNLIFSTPVFNFADIIIMTGILWIIYRDLSKQYSRSVQHKVF